MPRYQRPFFKAAQAIHRKLARTRENSALPQLAGEFWQRLVAIHRQITMAQACGWHAAAQIRTAQLREHLDEHQRAIRFFVDTLPPCLAPKRLSTAADIYRDLVALQQEDFKIEIDLKVRQLRVRTEPIELDSIPLGRFEICLEWQQLPDPFEAYRIVALDPNPAASDDTVTHPHLRDERLCEGDGRAGIRSALAEGRLYDFFVIVDRLLHTYARGQAFVELSQWSGMPAPTVLRSLLTTIVQAASAVARPSAATARVLVGTAIGFAALVASTVVRAARSRPVPIAWSPAASAKRASVPIA